MTGGAPAPPGVVVGVVVSTGTPHVVTRLQHLRPGARGPRGAAVASPWPHTQTLQAREGQTPRIILSLRAHLSHCLSSSLAGETFLKTFYPLVLGIYLLLQFSNSLLVQLALSVSILFIGLKFIYFMEIIIFARPGLRSEDQPYPN